MDLDLHIHSDVSDGSLSPRAVVQAAAAARLDVIAIADHDTVAGIPEALESAEAQPIEVIPAVEISASLEDVDLHILGYFVDPANRALRGHTRDATERRESRMCEMIGRLSEQGIEITFDAVSTRSSGRGTLGRPHLARALVDAGYVETVPEAFDRYIGNLHPAYIPTRLLDPGQAIELIHGSGGISVWAHPPSKHLGALLPVLEGHGLQGLEVYRPKTPRRWVRELERIAKERDLLICGGSDWHGPEQGPLGEFRVDARDVGKLLDAGGM